MIDLRNAQRIVVLGGGTAGWYAALTLRRLFSPRVDVRVIESSKIGIVGVGEGGLLNLVSGLIHNQIDIDEFVRETGAAFKWGFCYEGWRTGQEDDKFYHLFVSSQASASQWQENGFFPYFSAMINQNLPLDSYVRGSELVRNNAPQEEARTMLNKGDTDFITSYHFDSYKMAKYLKKVALSRGVTHQDTIVEDVEFDEKGFARRLRTETQEVIEFDFLVDASGLSRKVHGSYMDSKWRSFKDYLLMDRAIPFHMPHPRKNPMLVTRAIAMDAGWMWQIPLIERVGAGYVFSSDHMTEDRAIAEVETRLGYSIEPQRTLKFDPGCYENVWINNVMSVGLASGFVEPLEATSIGQMLEQVRNLERVFVNSQGLISQNAIRDFNHANLMSWMGIRDFLRMHYDSPRRDTSLWQAVAESPYPDSYKELKACMQERSPRMIDIENYAVNGWYGIFHVINWMFVAAPLGLISHNATINDLAALPKEKQVQALNYIQYVKNLQSGSPTK